MISLHVVCIVRNPYYVTRTSTNGIAVSLSHVSVCITRPVYCTAIGGSFGDVIRTIQTLCNNIINYQFYQYYQYYQSQAPVGYSHFHIGCVFVEYGLFNRTNLKQNLI